MMPTSKSKTSAASPLSRKFESPGIGVRRSRRLTLAGPSQLLSKASVSPVVVLDNDVLGKIKRGLSKAAKPQSRQRLDSKSKVAVKKTGRKTSPKKAKAQQASPKPKTAASPARPRRSAVKKLSPKRSPSPKHASSRQKKSPSPKSNKTSPLLLRTASPRMVAQSDKSKTVSTRKTLNATRNRGRSRSPASNKKPASVEKQKKSPALRTRGIASPPKPVGKRKLDLIVDAKVKEESSSPQKKRQRTSESHSVAKKAPKEKSPSPRKSGRVVALKVAEKLKLDATGVVENKKESPPPEKRKPPKSGSRSVVKVAVAKKAELSFTELNSKAAKSNETKMPASRQNSTPVKPKLSENDVSWSMSSIRKKLAGITPFRMRDVEQTPTVATIRQRKSVLLSADTKEKRKAARKSVGFAINSKDDRVKELKQRASRKHFCYRVLKFMLMLGLPVAVAVGSVLVYNGLII